MARKKSESPKAADKKTESSKKSKKSQVSTEASDKTAPVAKSKSKKASNGEKPDTTPISVEATKIAEPSKTEEPPVKAEAEKTEEQPAKAEAEKSEEPAQNGDGTTDGAIVDRPLVQTGRFKILDDVLEEAPAQPARKGLRSPMVFDLFLAVGLLVAMVGFSAGLFRLFITHLAEQSILQHDYKAAISLLKGSPFTTVFNFGGNESEELLAQALYLDAIDKLGTENDKDMNSALKELEQIRPGSRYFTMAQEILTENFVPSSTTLQGSAETVESNPPPPSSNDGGFEMELQLERR